MCLSPHLIFDRVMLRSGLFGGHVKSFYTAVEMIKNNLKNVDLNIQTVNNISSLVFFTSVLKLKS